MSPVLASWLVFALTLYLAVGLLFAIPFVTVGVARIDPAARGAGWGFRIVLIPGVTALWPLLALRWLRGQREPPAERAAHRRAVARPGGAA